MDSWRRTVVIAALATAGVATTVAGAAVFLVISTGVSK